jgi:two-component system, chemotaxis family, CheB/CheR fusion protein
VLTGTPHTHSTAVSRRILIVDDNRDAADSLALLLQLDGHDVQVAYEGEAALQACAARAPDIALLDIGMPKIDGYELARRMRAQSWGGRIQLVAVTGWGQQADRLHALDAGFDAHLTKPVSAQALASILAGSDPQTAAA